MANGLSVIWFDSPRSCTDCNREIEPGVDALKHSGNDDLEHYFHLGCAQQWIYKNRDWTTGYVPCPVCSKGVDVHELLRLMQRSKEDAGPETDDIAVDPHAAEVPRIQFVVPVVNLPVNVPLESIVVGNRFIEAAEKGDLAALQNLYSGVHDLLRGELQVRGKLSIDYIAEALLAAARNQHSHIITTLLAYSSFSPEYLERFLAILMQDGFLKDLYIYLGRMCVAAAKQKHLLFIQGISKYIVLLKEQLKLTGQQFDDYIRDAFWVSINSSYFEAIKYLLNYLTYECYEQAVGYFAEMGFQKELEMFLSYRRATEKTRGVALIGAAERNQYSVIQALLDKRSQGCSISQTDFGQAIEQSAMYDNIQALTILLENAGFEADLTGAMEKAAQFDHSGAVMVMLNRCKPFNEKYVSAAINKAVAHGCLGVLYALQRTGVRIADQLLANAEDNFRNHNPEIGSEASQSDIESESEN